MTSSNGKVNGAAFDIDEIRAVETDELSIVHPVTGEPTTWVWTLAGPGHEASVAVANEIQRETLKRQRDQEQAVVNRKKYHPQNQTVDEVKRENATRIAARVLGWTPARINKQEYPYSVANVVKLLLDPAYVQVYSQLLDHFNATDSFMPRSASKSATSLSETSS